MQLETGRCGPQPPLCWAPARSTMPARAASARGGRPSRLGCPNGRRQRAVERALVAHRRALPGVTALREERKVLTALFVDETFDEPIERRARTAATAAVSSVSTRPTGMQWQTASL